MLSKNLKNLREKNGLSKAELGRRSGVHPNTIKIIENSSHMPSLITLHKLANALGVTVNDLIN